MNQTIVQIYNNIPRNIFSIYTTGGGIQSLNWLFTVPGASKSIIQAGVPYSRSSLNEILGESTIINQSCSSNTTEQLAIEALKNCVSHILLEERSFSVLSSSNVFGIACSSALVSNTPKKGSHRCYVSSASSKSLKTWSLTLSKGARTREGEDYVCSRMILNSILSNSNISIPTIDYLLEGETEQHQLQNREEDMINKLYQSEIGMILFVKKSSSLSSNSNLKSNLNDDNNSNNNNNNNSDNLIKKLENEFHMFDDIRLPPGSLVYPGSFNPLHEGHVQLVKTALSEIELQINKQNNISNDNLNENSSQKQQEEEKQQKQQKQQQQQLPIIFEIAVINADKPPLSREDLVKRVMAFSSSGLATQLLESFGLTNVAVVITSQPLFVNKVELFPNCRILLGADTFSRLLNEKYYDNSRENMILALGKILQKNTLIIGGRVSSNDEFITADNIILQNNLPKAFVQQILSISESSFRCDISSTVIRNRIQNQSNSNVSSSSSSSSTTTTTT